jgi:hypothetical protein
MVIQIINRITGAKKAERIRGFLPPDSRFSPKIWLTMNGAKKHVVEATINTWGVDTVLARAYLDSDFVSIENGRIVDREPVSNFLIPKMTQFIATCEEQSELHKRRRQYIQEVLNDFYGIKE